MSRFVFFALCSLATALAAQERAAVEVASVKAFTDKVLVYSGVSTQPGGRLSAKATTLKGTGHLSRGVGQPLTVLATPQHRSRSNRGGRAGRSRYW